MKVTLVIIFLFLSFPVYSQKENFIGGYEQHRRGDTSIYMYLSYDSVTEIRTTWRKSKDFTVQIKRGVWQLEKDTQRFYKGFFTFSDGSVKEVQFSAEYNSIPMNDSIPPDGYSMGVDGVRCSKTYGRNGLWGKAMKSIKGSQL